ncbi:MAG: hypothetical protein ABSA57_15450 [Candidatus Acidiferrales bacterium]
MRIGQAMSGLKKLLTPDKCCLTVPREYWIGTWTGSRLLGSQPFGSYEAELVTSPQEPVRPLQEPMYSQLCEMELHGFIHSAMMGT